MVLKKCDLFFLTGFRYGYFVFEQLFMLIYVVSMDGAESNIVIVDAQFLRLLIQWLDTLDLSELEKEELFFQILEEYQAVYN